jgi:MFS family permease
MAIWGMGVMMGPIMGPSLGAWLTETYSWHWVFFVNLPFGIFTVLGLVIFMDETKEGPRLRFDWFGFTALAIAIGALQLALDRGEQPVRPVQGSNFLAAACSWLRDGAGAVRDHGAVFAVPAERDRLSHHHRRAAAGDPRHAARSWR